MALFVANLARLRAATASGHLPPDLGRWAVDLLADLEPVAERLERRNRILRAAAAGLSGSKWARARRIAREVRVQVERPVLLTRAAALPDDGVRALVGRALMVDPETPRSPRHLLRLLSDARETLPTADSAVTSSRESALRSRATDGD